MNCSRFEFLANMGSEFDIGFFLDKGGDQTDGLESRQSLKGSSVFAPFSDDENDDFLEDQGENEKSPISLGGSDVIKIFGFDAQEKKTLSKKSPQSNKPGKKNTSIVDNSKRKNKPKDTSINQEDNFSIFENEEPRRKDPIDTFIRVLKKSSENTSGVKQLSAAAQQALKKAVVTPNFENLKTVPAYELSKKQLQKERKKEREKTKGNGWYGLPATEMTDEVKNDLEILQMRSVLDPKHFYKKNDLKVLPKYFQVGKVMDAPLDFYNNRLTKKERKRTLVDELLADAEFQKYNKRKYKDIMEEKQKTHYKSWKKAKKLKKKKK